MNIEELTKEIISLKEENAKLKEQLQKYTHSQKEYYEKNKELVMLKASENIKKLKKTNPEKIKEYARRAYLKKKEKLQNEQTLENQPEII
jgi:hypothetical protein